MNSLNPHILYQLLRGRIFEHTWWLWRPGAIEALWVQRDQMNPTWMRTKSLRKSNRWWRRNRSGWTRIQSKSSDPVHTFWCTFQSWTNPKRQIQRSLAEQNVNNLIFEMGNNQRFENLESYIKRWRITYTRTRSATEADCSVPQPRKPCWKTLTQSRTSKTIVVLPYAGFWTCNVSQKRSCLTFERNRMNIVSYRNLFSALQNRLQAPLFFTLDLR